jgi:hypothetical protein
MSIAIPSLRGAIAVPSWAKNDLWRRARAVPSLDLRFAESKSLVDAVSGQQLITFTRASDGAVVNSAGQIEIVAANVPRFTHDPVTLESLGLLVEEQRANSIRNNTMVGAVAGTPGTLPTNWVAFGTPSFQVIGTGVENGITYLDLRLTSASAGAIAIVYEAINQAAASNGQTWTASQYIKLVGGSLANLTVANRLQYRDSGGANVAATDIPVTPTASSLITQRAVSTATAASASVAFVTSGTLITFTGVGDITLRIGMPQLEQGAFVTSVIPTTATAVTRSADVASITGSAFSGFYNQTEGTILASGSRYGTADGRFAGFDSGSISDAYVLTASSVRNVVISSVSNGGFGGGVTTANSFAYLAPIKAAATFSSADNETACLNGGAVASGAATAPSASLTTMRIGAQAGPASFYNGTIHRLTFFPQRLTNSTLQNITL